MHFQVIIEMTLESSEILFLFLRINITWQVQDYVRSLFQMFLEQ